MEAGINRVRHPHDLGPFLNVRVVIEQERVRRKCRPGQGVPQRIQSLSVACKTQLSSSTVITLPGLVHITKDLDLIHLNTKGMMPPSLVKINQKGLFILVNDVCICEISISLLPSWC